MDKYTAAIKYFEDAIQEADEIIADCNYVLGAELMEQRQYFEIAIEVLKEAVAKQEGAAGI